MPKAVSREVKHQALTLLQKGTSQVKVADHLGVSDRTIRRLKSKAEKHGDVEGGKKKTGRKSKLSPEMELVLSSLQQLTWQLLLKMVFYEPSAQLDEYVNEFNKRYPHVNLDMKYLSRLFKAKAINRKKVPVFNHSLILACI